jgi:hypothetical protein
MNSLKSIYNLRGDDRRIRIFQEASIDKNSYVWYKVINGLLFGTKEWFDAIEHEIIPKYLVKDIISKVYMSGHNDYPEFEVENSEGKTVWTRLGYDAAYQVGKKVELIYVEQKI